MILKKMTLSAICVMILVSCLSCTDLFGDGSGTGNENEGGETVDSGLAFPELDSFMPEPDVPMQKKSAKKGICTNWLVPEMPDLAGSGVSWAYNWSHDPLSSDRWAMLKSNGMTFYPMVWNAGFSSDNLATFMAADPNSDYVLAYNEPNLTDQANMTPEAAARKWPEFVAAAKELGLKIVGPAVNYGTLPGYNDPVVWYDEFLAQPGVSLDDIDAIALHCYMPDGESLKSLMIRKFYKYGKPLWLTEFENGDANSESSQILFCQEAVAYLEADPLVEKYAWFMDNVGSDNTAPHFPIVTLDKTSVGGMASALTDLGKVYTGMSTFDKDNWYPVDVNIPAEHYSGQIIEETAGSEEWGRYVETNITNDVYGNLELRNLSGEEWVEYNVNIPESTTYRIDLRYSSRSESVVKIDCQGAISAIGILPPTTSTQPYSTAGIEMALPEGRQTVRVAVPTGSINLNWLRFTSPID